ncbi:MAG: hypothetical protein U0Z26_17090 [Anaerolineales bacterium]
MFGTGWDSIEEQSVAIAASLADLGLRSRKSVGMISNGRTLAWLPPQKAKVNAGKLCRLWPLPNLET